MEKEIFADLHNHTTASDGDFTPEQVIEKAKDMGIRAIAITDHDTVNGLKSAIEAGKKYGIEVITGAEISVRFKRSFFTGTLHLLCYFPAERLDDEDFITNMNLFLSNGRGPALAKARINEINAFFGPDGQNPRLCRNMEYNDIATLSPNITRRHFSLALKEIFNIKEEGLLNSIIGNDSPAYLPSGIRLEDVRTLMNKERLFCVLAHPAAGSFPGKGHYKEVLPPVQIVLQLFPEFIEAGIRGLEVFYPGHTKNHQEFLSTLAIQHDLIVTGGSDSHDRTERPPGVAGLSEEEYLKFKNLIFLS
jgi:3',5'-nucleoside bisphosphate phosphatase